MSDDDDKTDHPFQPGTKVALFEHGDESRLPIKCTVEEVHKTGRFTIRYAHGAMNSSQWRPSKDYSGEPIAHNVGGFGSYRRASVRLWSERICAAFIFRR